MYVPLLDRLLYRHPFEGRSARRYARHARPAFGDFDDRLLDRLAPELGGVEGLGGLEGLGGVEGLRGLGAAGGLGGLDGGGRRLLDLGCGPGTLARRAAARFGGLHIVAIDPSRDFARGGVVRAAGEALPLAARSIDVAICLSSIRYVRDRAATLAELRRVVRGVLVIVELDPEAEPARVAHHAERLGSVMLRQLFGPLMLRTAPPAATIAALAGRAGFALRALQPDPIQPVYIMELA